MRQTNQPSGSKTTYVYEYLKKAILSAELRPGKIISENDLVSTLNISRTPIREAIKVLEKEGLVQVYKGVGVIVKHITIKEVKDACELRVLLECYAMEHAYNRILPWQIDQMINQWEELLNRIQTSGNFTQKELTSLDIATHDLVFDHANNQMLTSVHEDMHDRITRYQALFTRLVDDAVSTAKQHIDLLNALRGKDVRKYKTLLEQQVYNPISFISNNLLE